MGIDGNVLLTGATGFLGRKLAALIPAEKLSIIGRRLCPEIKCRGSYQVAIDTSSDYTPALCDVDVIIHSAARVHIMDERSKDPLSEFREVNTYGTLNLARQAADAGIRRFIFISTIKVNGEQSYNSPFTPDDKFVPTDPYGLSKYEAEQGLLEIANETEMDVVIIRSPLIYGPNVKGNFSTLLALGKKNIPLPFAGITNNKRSFVALDNIADFIMLCTNYKHTSKAANQIFLVADEEDLSTAELLHKIAKAYNKKSTLFFVPVVLLDFLAKSIGKGAVSNRLLGSLQVDSSKAKELLNWTPVITMEQQLLNMLNSVER